MDFLNQINQIDYAYTPHVILNQSPGMQTRGLSKKLSGMSGLNKSNSSGGKQNLGSSVANLPLNMTFNMPGPTVNVNIDLMSRGLSLDKNPMQLEQKPSQNTVSNIEPSQSFTERRSSRQGAAPTTTELDDDLSGSQSMMTTQRKRSTKAKKKYNKKVDAAVDETPVDNTAIKQAMDHYNMRAPDQPKRGRKPVREDIYISESLEKINYMEARLQNERETLTPKERDELRNKASALRSRVNRKLEHRTQLVKLQDFKDHFKTLSKIMVDEMDGDTRDRVMTQLMTQIAPSSKPTAGGKVKGGARKTAKQQQ